jgi:catechol 2,3-dioxygenase-like lactoylglutathione lyase family enzyme
MTLVAEEIGMRVTGIAGATLTTADVARARVFYIVRLGFPLLLDETDLFAFRAGSSVITVRRLAEERAAAGPAERPHSGLGDLALWCAGGELRRVADALAGAGIEHSGVQVNPRFAMEYVAFEDPDGIGWELHVC